jgi:error-prone DNA polymerase
VGLSHDFAQPAPSSARTHAGEPCRSRFTGCPYSVVYENGVNIRYAGLVICRQRPGTAGGVVFMTLEDETGFVNVVIWESVFQRYSVLAKTVSFLGITGKLQVEDGIVHLIANKLWEPRVELKPIGAPSRNFH